MTEKTIVYKASPTAAKMHRSNKLIRGLMGPVGSGKTVACIKELMRMAKDQWPNDDGDRLTRWAIIRNTSIELRTTTLNTFRQWIPSEICAITLNPLIKANVECPLPDGTCVKAEFLFLALDRDEDVRKLLSLEVTGGFTNETRELSYSVIKALRERSGRYPSWADNYSTKTLPPGTDHPCKRKSIVMDTNPPSEDHWWYELDINGFLGRVSDDEQEQHRAETARIFEFFTTPSPLIKQPDGSYKPSPLAENIKYLRGGYAYYLDMVAGNDPDHINVMVLGNYGMLRSGKPVYPEYNDQVHCREIKPIKSLPLGLGWDFGLTPSLVITQMTSLGQLRVLAELVGFDTSVRAFARDVVKPFLSANFAGYEIAFSVGDPSGNNRGEGEGRAAIHILNDTYVNENPDGDIIKPLNLGFDTLPAPTNDITRRLEAVKAFLTKMVDGGEPGYLLNKNCRVLRKGKQGSYKFKKLQVSGSPRYHEKPDKDDYSHPADAEQYAALGWLEGYDMNVGSVPASEYDIAYEKHRDAVGGY